MHNRLNHAPTPCAQPCAHGAQLGRGGGPTGPGGGPTGPGGANWAGGRGPDWVTTWYRALEFGQDPVREPAECRGAGRLRARPREGRAQPCCERARSSHARLLVSGVSNDRFHFTIRLCCDVCSQFLYWSGSGTHRTGFPLLSGTSGTTWVV